MVMKAVNAMDMSGNILEAYGRLALVSTANLSINGILHFLHLLFEEFRARVISDIGIKLACLSIKRDRH